ncbi:hypothetical protein EG329_009587 [Mollisiaceae sp. DMI_Dod_QoI]|nr:hypothetical protein EG329_009587 [Helotiales sp. DMI_Dod_QoI]
MSTPSSAFSTKLGAIITGAASGVGLTLTRHLLSKGWVVVMVDVDPAGEALAKEFGSTVLWSKTDVGSWESQLEMFEKAFAWCPQICFLAANAGMMTNVAAPFGLFSADAEGLEKPSLQVLEVNLTGIIYGIKIFLHHIRKANAGEKDGVKARIVITGSEGGFYPLPYDPVYCARLTRSLGWRYLEMFGITVNSINPGYMKTGLVAPLIPVTPDEYETPMSVIMQAYDALMEGKMSGQTIEASGKNLYYQKQQAYPDEVARWLMEDGPAFWADALTKLGAKAAMDSN